MAASRAALSRERRKGRKVASAELGEFSQLYYCTRKRHLLHHRVALGCSALERVAISRAPSLSSLNQSSTPFTIHDESAAVTLIC